MKRPVSLHYVSQIFLLHAAALYRMNISNPALLATISADLIINGTADEIMKERETEILHCNQIVSEMRNGFRLKAIPMQNIFGLKTILSLVLVL